jgi:methyltransferase
MISSLTALVILVAIMLIELRISRSNERWMFERGAVVADDPAFSTMRWAYPAAFVAMAIEGVLRGGASRAGVIAGVVVLVVGKVIKFWAIASLGKRWTYRVVVVPGAPLVSGGPYRFIRHPNYVGVVGELVGMALLSGALVAGALSVIGFGWLLMRRIAAEERALGLRTNA